MVAYTLLEFRQSLAGSLPSDSSSRCTLPAVATKGAPTPQHKRRAGTAVFPWPPLLRATLRYRKGAGARESPTKEAFRQNNTVSHD